MILYLSLYVLYFLGLIARSYQKDINFKFFSKVTLVLLVYPIFMFLGPLVLIDDWIEHNETSS